MSVVNTLKSGNVRTNRLTLGEGVGSSFTKARRGTLVHDFGSIADTDNESVNVTVTGAAVGDMALVSAGVDVSGLQLTAAVIAADTVEVTASNTTGGAVDLASTTLTVVVLGFE